MNRFLTVLSLAAVSSLASVASAATIPALVRSASTHGNFMPPVPPGTRAITRFEIEVEACRTLGTNDFKVATRKLAERAYSVEFQWNGFDCFGPTHRQTIELSTDKLPARAQVTVKNPLLIEDRTTH